MKFDVKGNRVGGARLLAVVTVQPKSGGRHYREATDMDSVAVFKAMARVKKVATEKLPNGLSPIPDEMLPPHNTLGLRVPAYGVRVWGDLFSCRQKLALATLSRAVVSRQDSAPIKSLLALAVSRTADYGSANCSLHAGRDVVRNTWARNALPIVWDYYEAAPFGSGSGAFDGACDWISRVAEKYPSGCQIGQVQIADACESSLPNDGARVWFTDPPYYNAIGYAESSDFFFVWLKRMLAPSVLPRDPYDDENPLVPKVRECIQDDTFERIGGVCKDKQFFEATVCRAFVEGRRVTSEIGIGCVVFAHKTTEGWEALLGGMRDAGWTISASWPIETEMSNKMSAAQGGDKKAMLLASVHLVCRPRTVHAGVGDWADVARELPERISQWMERLAVEGVRGADLVFACIGPAMEIYSRYERVEDAEGREVPLGGDPEADAPHKRGFLAYVWETVGRIALHQVLGGAESRARNGAAGALEEDARLTALFLWTLQSTTTDTNGGADASDEADDDAEADDDEGASEARGKKKGLSLVYDVARRFAQPLGIHLDLWEGRIIETDKGVVRLLPVAERAKQLFGDDGADAVAGRIEAGVRRDPQMGFDFIFDRPDEAPKVKGRKGKPVKGAGAARTVRDEDLATRQEATTLDRVHAAMLLQASGRANALRAFLKAETERGSEFLRLANALSALYPKESEEKRLLDAMILAVPR